VKRQRRFGTESEAASIEATQIKALIDGFSRRVELLECDIVDEEERTGCHDLRQPGYSVLARGLIARRDNLIATIAALQERLSETAPPNSTKYHPPLRPLLPA
jgi:hypothetical protein